MGTSLTQLASLAVGNPVQGLVFNPPPVPTPAQSLVFTPPSPPATPVTAVPPAVAPPQSPQIALAPPVPLPPQLTPQSRAPAPQDDATAPPAYYPPAPPTQPYAPSGQPPQPGGGTMAVPSTPNQQNPDLSGGQDGQPVQPGVTPAAFRPGVPTPRPYGAIPTPNGGVPKWQTMPPAALYSPAGLPPLFYAMARPESGLNNRSVGDNGLATGYLQIQTPTWREFAPKAGVDVSRWPTAASAPLQVQWAVAQTIPLGRWTAGKDGALAMYPWARPDMTVGQIQAAAALAGPQGYNPTSSMNGGDRDPEHWGTTPYGGYPQGPGNMPQSHSDVGGIMKAGLYLLPFLSIFAKGGAMPMLASWGSFMTGFQKGQILAQQQAHQQWKDGVEETTERMKQESMEAGDAFATYQNDEKALDEALYAVAAKYGDDPMRAALASGGAAAVHRLQQNRDNYFTDLNKTRLANEAEQQKIDEGKRKAQQEAQQAAAVAGLDQQYLQDHPNASQAELANAHQINLGRVKQEADPSKTAGGEEAPIRNVIGPDGKPTGQQVREGKDGGYFDPASGQRVTLKPGERTQPEPKAGGTGTSIWSDAGGDEGGGGDEAAPSPPAAPQTPAQAPAAAPPPTTGGQPQTAPAPTQPTGAGPSGGPPAAPAAAPAAMPKNLASLPANVRQLGLEMFRGGEAASGTDKGVINAAEAYNQWLGSQVDKIQSSGATGEDVVNQLRKIDPVSANTLQRLIDVQAGVPGTGGFGTRLANYWNRMQNLAVQADPSWNAGKFEASRKTRDAYTPQGAMGKTLLRSQRLRQTTQSLWADAATLPAGPIPENILQQMLQGGVAADPRYTKFATDWHNFATDIQAVNTGGAPTVTLTSMLLDTLKRGATPAMVRTAIKADLNSALGSIDSAVTGYRQAFPKEANPAMFDQRTYSELWQLWNGDVNTGALGEGAPPLGAVQDGHVYIGGDPSDERNWKAQ